MRYLLEEIVREVPEVSSVFEGKFSRLFVMRIFKYVALHFK